MRSDQGLPLVNPANDVRGELATWVISAPSYPGIESLKRDPPPRLSLALRTAIGVGLVLFSSLQSSSDGMSHEVMMGVGHVRLTQGLHKRSEPEERLLSPEAEWARLTRSALCGVRQLP
jgi:hypothetical protein